MFVFKIKEADSYHKILYALGQRNKWTIIHSKFLKPCTGPTSGLQPVVIHLACSKVDTLSRVIMAVICFLPVNLQANNHLCFGMMRP